MEIENPPVNLSTVSTSMTSTDSLLSLSNGNNFVIQSQNGPGTDSLLDSSLQLGAAYERRDSLQFGAAYERRDSVDSTSFSLRPSFKQKFRAPMVKNVIRTIASQRLNNALYDKDQAPGWANEISREIKQKLIELDLKQYKYVVNVTIMENKAAGARIQLACSWDMDTDNVAYETFKNDSIVCVIMAFGVYFY
ncbi:Tctex1 domain-containing protein 2 [Gigaspora margarita]|uniref:Tctex1 domain-containing protein 2 n=1 Tax=Gigaspora margarita TaxID=4874 RepID=A0A8H4AMS9_GIGMA|nr:Tctex1 domain-containing protein 2 [Gigaspora margarita]